MITSLILGVAARFIVSCASRLQFHPLARIGHQMYHPTIPTQVYLPHHVMMFAPTPAEKSNYSDGPISYLLHPDLIHAMVKGNTAEAIADLWPELGSEGTFSRRLAELMDFKDRFGNVDVPLEYARWRKIVPTGRSAEGPTALGGWCLAQRRRKEDGTLKPIEEAALTALGFRWKLNPEELGVNESMDRSVEYIAQFGDTPPSVTPVKEKPAANVERLWPELDLAASFSRRLAQLANFKDSFGNADVPLGLPSGLGEWVLEQRKRKEDGLLEQDEEAALSALGLRWEVDLDVPDLSERTDRLVKYMGQFGKRPEEPAPESYNVEPLVAEMTDEMTRKSGSVLTGEAGLDFDPVEQPDD